MNRQMNSDSVSRRVMHAGLIAAVAFIAGCAGQPRLSDYVPEKMSCCTRIEEFTFRSIPLGEDVPVSISAKDSTYTFTEKPQHFVAFKVPDGFVATTIQAKTYLSTDFLPNATALFPEFIFLDANFGLLRRAELGNMQVAGEFWRGGAFAGRSSVPGLARYFIIVAAESGGQTPPYRAENGRPYQIPAAALGSLSVRLFGEKATK
jgi:hypothetical protein